tara:strand:+ start:130 stop:705 length:576 start_codon:yes stop_codon:yes gene_type:complete
MKLKKVLSNKNKFNKIEKKFKKLNKKLEIKFYIFIASNLIGSLALLFATGFSNNTMLTFISGTFLGVFFVFINAFILNFLYKKSSKLNIFDFYNSESEKFSNKYYEYLKLSKKEDIYYENLINSIKNSKVEEIVDCENEINSEIETLNEVKSKKVIKLVTEKLNDKREKEHLKELFKEKRNEIKKEVLMEI